MPAQTTEEGRARALANLRPPIRKGEVLNPNGRRGKISLLDAIRQSLQKPFDAKDVTGQTNLQQVADELVHIATDRGHRQQLEAIRLLLAYFEGQPTQPIKIEIEKAARRAAEATGADPAWIIEEAERIAAELFDAGEYEGDVIP